MRYLALLLSAIALFSCGNFDYSGKGKDVPTAGELELWADHGDSLLITQCVELFEKNYPKAKIKVIYAPETDILKAVNDGVCRACILHRNFDTVEKSALESRDFKVRSVKIATTSTAVLVNKENKIDSLSLDILKEILSGKSKVLQLGEQANTAIFDQAGGSNFLQLSRWLIKDGLELKGAQIRSLKSPQMVLRWLQTHNDALGFVNVNTIADRGDPEAANWLEKLKVIKIQSNLDGKFVYPFQSQMASRQYPFTMEVYLHDLQGYSGLASGLQAWIYSQPGQILIKKSGLLPSKDYGRTIEIGTE
jgi:phosphate transport system substrate-binding protein